VKKMMLNKLLAIGILIPLLVLIPPNVYAKHQSDRDRYNVGYADGSNAASSDSTYNAACDPNNTHLQNGHPHTVPYCNGWADGYAATWNHNPGPTPIGHSPSPSLKDKFCNFVHSGDGAAASALVTLLGYPTVAAAAQAICV
jgi:hypothetical protein